jgi:hypothetical protein
MLSRNGSERPTKRPNGDASNLKAPLTPATIADAGS